MSANLDKSLDDLVGNRRQNARRRGAGRRAPAKPSVGGVKKSAKTSKAAAKVVHPTPVAPTASSKIIVSGLVRLSYSITLLLIDPEFTNPIISLPMCLRPISRYVELQACALALIAIFVSNPSRCQQRRHAYTTFVSSLIPPPLGVVFPRCFGLRDRCSFPMLLRRNTIFSGWHSRSGKLSSVLAP